MSKEKFQIPIPDERTITREINQIVATGVQRNESFLSFLKSMYQHVGLKHLFSDRSESAFALLTIITFFVFYIFMPDPAMAKTEELYACIFLFSPVLFIALSIYTYSNKMMNGTYEVEMVCKYHVFQIIAFRMLMFSVITILVNGLTILFIVMTYEYIQFFRAFMISNTGLFLFSIIFLYVLMLRRTTVMAILTIFGWLIGNVLLWVLNNKLYSALLMNIPLFIYGIIIFASIFVYMKFIKKLIHYRQSEVL